MKKIASYISTNLAYSIPFNRVANIYESEVPSYEVASHTGGVAVEWEFHTFATIQEAQAYALSFIAPSHIACTVKQST